MDNERIKALLEHRTKLIELETNQIGLFDKSTLAISSGAFGLSIVFLEKIVGSGDKENMCLLTYSWVFLLLTILTNLISYLVSWEETRAKILLIDKSIKKDDEKVFNDAENVNFTKYLNYISLVSLLFGLSLLAAFAFWNI